MAGSLFIKEEVYDILNIGGITVEDKDDVPHFLRKGEIITWESDVDYVRSGWQLCFITRKFF